MDDGEKKRGQTKVKRGLGCAQDKLPLLFTPRLAAPGQGEEEREKEGMGEE